MKLRVATSNKGKLREFRQVLEPLGYEVTDISDLGLGDIEETGSTFAANAEIKTLAAFEACDGKDAVVADDSGIVVDALDGAPGIHSARYAGIPQTGEAQDAANRFKLLDALQEVPVGERSARFVASLALRLPGEEQTHFFEGTFEGEIGFEEAGDNGFGYDSIFLVDGGACTSAELSPEAKNARSHRGEALRKLEEFLRARA